MSRTTRSCGSPAPHPGGALAALRVRYVRYGELERNRESIARFGAGLRPIEAIARELV